MNVDLLKKICTFKAIDLYDFLLEELKSMYTLIDSYRDPHDGWICAHGTTPIALIAHLDTVHRKPVESIKLSKAMHLSSPQGIGGDDRVGVFIILTLLSRIKNFKPTIIFTLGEETGGHGSKALVRSDIKLDLNFMIQYDRSGALDVVRYSDVNEDLTNEIVKYGFKSAYGSFTDISILAPHYGVSAVNISSAYYKPHTTAEYIDLYDLDTIISKSIRFLSNKKFVETAYKYKASRSSNYSKSKVEPTYYRDSVFDWDSKGVSSMVNRDLYKTYGECASCGQLHTDLKETDLGKLCNDCFYMYKLNHGGTITCKSCDYSFQSTVFGDGVCPVCGFKNAHN